MKSRPIKVGIKEVAKRAGVHYSTASRALDKEQSQRISTEVVKRVRAAADDLGYRPNVIAVGLRTQRSRTVGVVVPDLSNPIFPPIFKGIEARAEEDGYVALLANGDHDPAHERKVLNAFLARQIDGLILATARLDDEMVSEARNRNIAVVTVTRSTNRIDVPSFVDDIDGGFRQLVGHLYDLGHRHIACITGPRDNSIGATQEMAFRQAMRDRGLRLAPGAMSEAATFSIAAGRVTAANLLSSGLRPTAIVSGSDLIALGCLDAFSQFDLSCPKDISLTGYNDMPLLDKAYSPLTTTRVDYESMGYEAMSKLLDLIAGRSSGTTEFEEHTLPVELVVRRTTQAPPQYI